MAISEAERKTFERVIAEVGSDPEKAEATLKVLFNVIKKRHQYRLSSRAR